METESFKKENEAVERLHRSYPKCAATEGPLTMRDVTDPDRLRNSLLESFTDSTNFQDALTSFPESDDASSVINSAALISILRGMAEQISQLERRLDRAEKGPWKADELPENVISQLADGVPPLKVFRKFRGMTQREVAARAGCTATYIAQIEHRSRCGSLKIFRRLANVLNIDVRELLER